MMKPALSFRQPQVPDSWQSLTSGLLIKEEINTLLNQWGDKFFGYHLLKLGLLSAELSVKPCSIKHQVAVSQSIEHADVIADIDDLPFLEHSVDVCLLSHALEFSIDPHHVVREANRVLIPNGYMVLTGFNPISLAGLNKLIPYRNKKSPWNERFFTPMRVKDWLHLMGYEILTDERRVFSMLSSEDKNSRLTNKCRQFMQRFFPSIGSIYFIVAKKRVLPLTPIKPKWQLRPRFNPVSASTKTTASSVLTNKSVKL